MAAAHVLHYGVGVPVRKVPAVLRALTGVCYTSTILAGLTPRVASSKTLPKQSYCLTVDVTQTESLPHDGCYPNHGGIDMVGEVSTVTRTEVLGAIRNRYLEAAKGDKSRMLDEFVALTGCHRKHAVWLLNQRGQQKPERIVPRGKRIYDEAVRQALVVVWETSDRICGKSVKGGAILCQRGGAIVDHLGPKLGIDFISELDWGAG